MRRPIVRGIFVGALLYRTSFGGLAADMPRIVQKDGSFALLVEGQPYLILGAQIHNSSAWPVVLPQIWRAIEFLRANTVEAPVY